MSSPDGPVPAPGDAVTPPTSRVAFERLRERTDELELIVSGLLAFALLTVPGRAFEAWAANTVHVEGVFEMALWFGFATVVGLSWSLAFAFMIHLAIRGYWVALIGLKSTFPDGIHWDRIPLMGPVSRAFHRERVGDLGSVIDRADRAASMLFAMAILLALSLVWVTVLAVGMILVAALFGAVLGDMDRIARIVLFLAYAMFMVFGMLPYVAEKYLARQAREGRTAPRVERLVQGILRVYSFVIPQRLILPVQLTLQSNLPGRGFMAVYVLVIMFAMVFGGLQIASSSNFSMLHRYDVLTAEAVDHGMTGAHYEDMRADDDVLLRYPMIPSDRISGSHLRLFIPHQPQRDNVLARERCDALVDGANRAKGDDAAALAVDCLSSLWTVTLDGRPVPLDDFLPIERRDLHLRGLVGYVAIADLPPGRHDLRLAWNEAGDAKGQLRRRDFRIPFWFTPAMNRDAIGD
ncbi:hypothetical protein [Luteimonas arsenica]|uniref:hypothetical protein n=1 Tax=Luteimonas arsenica TaxID=1586242 RepID=UPI0010556322|nr:hypothetical protein [Luteimonas arsenica]